MVRPIKAVTSTIRRVRQVEKREYKHVEVPRVWYKASFAGSPTTKRVCSHITFAQNMIKHPHCQTTDSTALGKTVVYIMQLI